MPKTGRRTGDPVSALEILELFKTYEPEDFVVIDSNVFLAEEVPQCDWCERFTFERWSSTNGAAICKDCLTAETGTRNFHDSEY